MMESNSDQRNQKHKGCRRVAFIVLGLVSICVLIVGSIFLFINRSNGKIESSDQVRTYILYVPKSYDSTRPTPLVITLHGFVEWPAHIMNMSGWNEVADEYGFIVVYPAGTKFPKRWSTDSRSRRPEDPMLNVIFISDLIDALSEQYNIDENRIYANGFSNGGGMAFLLACELADKITAIGGVSSADYYQHDDCQPSRPVPVITFHGTEDNFVSYYGRWKSPQTYQQPRVPNWIEAWAERNQCSLDPIELAPAGDVNGIRYVQCDQETEVVFYTIHGGGHAWPGGQPMPESIVGYTTKDINATTLMWEFFSQYSLDD